MSKISITEAAKLAGVSRATIYNDIENGTLSFETGAKGKKKIDISELQRVYKDLRMDPPEAVSIKVNKRQDRQNEAVSIVEKGGQVAVLQERLEAQKRQAEHLEELLRIEQEERRRERDVFRQFEEYFKEQLMNQSKSIENFTRLLEDQRHQKPDSSIQDLKSTVLSLKEELERQKQEAEKKEIARQQAIKKQQERLNQQKQALEAEQNISLWKKLFG